MVMHHSAFRETIDALLIRSGEKKGNHWCGMLTTGEIIAELNKIDETSHHRNIKAMVEMHYPGTRAESMGVSGARGWKLYIKVRTN